MISGTVSKACRLLAYSLLLFSFTLVGSLSPSTEAQRNTSWQQDQIVVNHSIDKVLPLLSKCRDYRHLFEDVTRSRPISSNQCYLEAKHPGVSFWMKFVLERPRWDADKKTVRLQGRLLEGNLKTFRVKLRLTKLGDRKTQIVFRMQADPDLPVPDSLVETKVKSIVRQALVKLSMRLLVGRY